MAEVSRREARRAAVFVLYQSDVTEAPLGSLYEGEVDDYTRRLVDAVSSRTEELDARITAAADEWTADRLAQEEGGSPERALEILGELSELAKAVEEELERAKRAAEADAAQS